MPLANPPQRGARTVEIVKTEEKGSDVKLATYLLLDAFQRDLQGRRRDLERFGSQAAD
jgi:hypothetical protein